MITPRANYQEFLEDCEILKKAGKTPIVAGAKDGTGVAVFSMAKSLDPVYQAADKMDQIAKMNSGELKFGDVMQPGYRAGGRFDLQGISGWKQGPCLCGRPG